MSRPAAPPPVVVHIERLIIDGADLQPRHAEALQRAIEDELRQLLQAGDWHPQSGSRARAEAPVIAFAGLPAQAGRDGARIAQSLHAAIGAPVTAGEAADGVRGGGP
jgi:hypothetical protein